MKKHIKTSPFPYNSPCHPRVFLSGIPTLLKKWMRFPLTTCGNDSMVRGFTLVELLVVVLIIGILSAIALPQYQKVVEKSKAMKIISLLKSMGQAAQEYYLSNGAYPTKFADLSVGLPTDFSEHETWWEGGSAITDTLSNGEWSFQLENTVWGNPAIYVGRLRGAYAGGGFGYRFGPNNATHEEISCSEHKSKYKKASGSYCVGLFGGQQIAGLDGWFNRAYKMP